MKLRKRILGIGRWLGDKAIGLDRMFADMLDSTKEVEKHKSIPKGDSETQSNNAYELVLKTAEKMVRKAQKHRGRRWSIKHYLTLEGLKINPDWDVWVEDIHNPTIQVKYALDFREEWRRHWGETEVFVLPSIRDLPQVFSRPDDYPNDAIERKYLIPLLSNPNNPDENYSHILLDRHLSLEGLRGPEDLAEVARGTVKYIHLLATDPTTRQFCEELYRKSIQRSKI